MTETADVEILLIEDNPGDADLVAEYLERCGGYRLAHRESLADAIEYLESDSEPIILSDLSLPDAWGLDTVRRLREASPNAPLVVLSGSTDEALALAAVKLGAQDYLLKGEVGSKSLDRSIRYARQRKQLEMKLVKLANFDHLTGLANRTTFRTQLEQALSRARRSDLIAAVVFIDLDRFKEVNDTFGHDVGDQLLREVALRLRTATREVDMVARLSGDEFAVVLENLASAETAMELAKRLLDGLSAPLELAQHPINLKASIGVACYPEAGSAADELLRLADQAMYVSKRKGRNRVELHCARAENVVPIVSPETQLHRAFVEKRFELHYQPIFDLETGRNVGSEALLRMNSIEGELIQADTFIPILERSELIFPVSEWILDQACAMLSSLSGNGSHLSVAVNVAARHMSRPELVTMVQASLDKYSVPGSGLELEITERALVNDTENLWHNLKALRDMGVSIAIDDFGTGYSSLQYLERFPVTTVKIDRGFIQPVGRSARGAVIASTMIELSHKLGLRVVGEGVETPEQLEFLRNEGCDFAQGYLLGRPAKQWALDDSWQGTYVKAA